MKRALTYSLKVSFTTAVLTPLLVTLVHFYFLWSHHFDPLLNAWVYNRLLLQLLHYLEASPISIIYWFLCIYLAILFLNRQSVSARHFKIYLYMIVVVLLILPWPLWVGYYLSLTSNRSSRIITVNMNIINLLCSALPLLASLTLYKLQHVANETSNSLPR
jgi:cytochrome c oxidase assembly factor CtaG